MLLSDASPLIPAFALLFGAFVQIAYGCALALGFLGPEKRRAWRVAALAGGVLAFGAAWIRSDILFMIGQLALCIAYIWRPDLGAGRKTARTTNQEAPRG
jgi:hypothetical protein